MGADSQLCTHYLVLPWMSHFYCRPFIYVPSCEMENALSILQSSDEDDRDCVNTRCWRHPCYLPLQDWDGCGTEQIDSCSKSVLPTPSTLLPFLCPSQVLESKAAFPRLLHFRDQYNFTKKAVLISWCANFLCYQLNTLKTHTLYCQHHVTKDRIFL